MRGSRSLMLSEGVLWVAVGVLQGYWGWRALSSVDQSVSLVEEELRWWRVNKAAV